MIYNRIPFILLLICCLAACKEVNTSQNKIAPKAKLKVAEAPVQSKTNEIWTSDNIVEQLTQYGKINQETKILITTQYGEIELRLYNETPLHRANFIHHVKTGYYNGAFFDRVVKDFVIQGGNSDDPMISIKQNQIGHYLIPAEFNSNLFHKKGALAMARSYDENPDKKSAPYEFYIVDGSTFNDKELAYIEKKQNITFMNAQKEAYKTIGGACHLDQQHTVFGEVTKGLHVIDEIAKVKVDDGDWPIVDVVMNIKIIE